MYLIFMGLLLADALRYLAGGGWWLALFPGLMLLVLVFDKKMSAREESSRQFASVGAAAAKPSRSASHALAAEGEEVYQPAYAAQRQKIKVNHR